MTRGFMNVGGGLTFLTHVLIIIIHWIIKKPIHFVIILLVFLFFSSEFIILTKTSIIDSNIEYIYNNMSGSEENFAFANNDDNLVCNYNNNNIDPSKKYIIFMMDDINLMYLRTISMKILNEAINRKIPYTLAITPLNTKFDTQLGLYLNQNKCALELAQYGFDNRSDISEFKELPENIAQYKLVEGLSILNNFTDKKITTFIAPDNIYSIGSLKALKKNDFKILSGKGEAFFDYSDINYSDNTISDIDLVVTKSIKNANIKGFSMIMIHSKDFIDEYGELDKDKYAKYLKLLDSLKEKGFSFTTISDYYNYLDKQGLKTDFFDKTVSIPEYFDKIVDLENSEKG